MSGDIDDDLASLCYNIKPITAVGPHSQRKGKGGDPGVPTTVSYIPLRRRHRAQHIVRSFPSVIRCCCLVMMSPGSDDHIQVAMKDGSICPCFGTELNGLQRRSILSLLALFDRLEGLPSSDQHFVFAEHVLSAILLYSPSATAHPQRKKPVPRKGVCPQSGQTTMQPEKALYTGKILDVNKDWPSI